MNIDNEKTEDIDGISKVIYKAFENHPHHQAGALPTEHLIVEKLRVQGALSLSLLAKIDNEIVGHIAFSPVEISGKTLKWFGLGPISVAPNMQGQGIGSKLINEGIKQLRVLGAKGVVLLGEPEYYRRFGFKAYPQLSYASVPAEYFLALALKDTPLPSGEVNYHKAFLSSYLYYQLARYCQNHA